MKSVLILSKWNAGGVALAVEQLRARGLRSVLISERPDNRNRDKCDDHVLLDWDSEDLPTLITRLDQRDIVPIAVVNMIEPLIPWQDAIAAHYDLPGVGAGLNVLASKALVRDHMRALGLSAIRFCGDPAEVDFFPAIVKPSRESAASWLVRRVDSPAELLAYQRHLAELGVADTELIIEEYLPGTEFSVDGPVAGGRFHPVLAVERPEHDDTRHHNAGLQIHPPQQDHVRDGVRALSEMIDTLCTDLHIDQLWLHVEGRVDEDGRTEIIEINPRPAGGMYSAVIHETSGIDPIEAFISMSLGEFTFTPERLGPLRDRPIIGLFDVEADELGIVEISTTEDDLRALPDVINAEVINGYQISSLEKENFFIRFAITADSVSQLRARTATILSTLDYRITAQP
ncbi:MAG: ATP-grasp domain-containing protein [Pseudonocardiaceae bacterium]